VTLPHPMDPTVQLKSPETLRASPGAAIPAPPPRGAGARPPKGRSRRFALPGFGLTLGFTLAYLGLLVVLPLATAFWKASSLGWTDFWRIVSEPRALAAFRLSFGAAFLAASINGVFGFLVAWVLTRYRFPGSRVVDALVDLPFALPTAVAGIALASIYAPNGWIGRLAAPFGIKLAFTATGIVIALVFISLPFTVRTLQPVIQDLDAEVEQAAASLGATRFQTFVRVILPELVPAGLTGFALAFARAVGEYGSVIFIAGNMPGKTEILPLLIVTKLEQYDTAGATALAVAMLVLSFAMLLAINLLQTWTARRGER
jgi:sulfate transport system permease protein